MPTAAEQELKERDKRGLVETGGITVMTAVTVSRNTQKHGNGACNGFRRKARPGVLHTYSRT